MATNKDLTVVFDTDLGKTVHKNSENKLDVRVDGVTIVKDEETGALKAVAPPPKVDIHTTGVRLENTTLTLVDNNSESPDPTIDLGNVTKVKPGEDNLIKKGDEGLSVSAADVKKAVFGGSTDNPDANIVALADLSGTVRAYAFLTKPTA